MRTIVLATVAATGMVLAGPLAPSAMPIDGAAIARLGQHVAAVIDVKTKKPKSKPKTTGTPPPPSSSSGSY